MSKDKNQGKVLVALSGGVDSATAAAILVKEGLDLTGVHLKFWSAKSDDQKSENARSTSQNQKDAAAICKLLGIPLLVWDIEKVFFEKVVQQYLDTYRLLQTPNPCIVCNRYIKFGYLLEMAHEQGFESVATGHWARIHCSSDRRREAQRVDCTLRTAKNKTKDQSYFLYRIAKQNLPFIHFPLGEIGSKKQVRQIARDIGLPVADKKDSQEICFVPDGAKKDFLNQWIPGLLSQGDVMDLDGKVLGKHEGLALYTEGQRKGIKIAGGERLYVVEKDKESNALVLGQRSDILRRGVIARRINWLHKPDTSNFSCQGRIRYNGDLVGCSVELGQDEMRVIFEEKLEGVAAGQSLVLYQGDVVLGGGIIISSIE